MAPTRFARGRSRALACLVGAGVALLALVAPAQEPAPGKARSDALKAILDDHVDWIMREYPEQASTKGDLRFNDRLTDVSPAGTARRVGAMRERLARLNALDASSMAEMDAVDAGLLRYELSVALEMAELHNEQMPINSLEGPHISLPQICDTIPLRTPQHLADYASRLEKMGVYVDQSVEQMRLGLAAGRVPPRVVLKRAVDQIGLHCSDAIRQDPTRSAYYRPFLAKPKDDPSASRARDAIAGRIIPALERLRDFVRDEYVPKCREDLAISAGIDGPRAYDLHLRYHTTLALSAREVHEIGLREVARIRAEMLRVIGETDFPRKGELSGDELLRAFLEFLRKNPRFYYTREEDMLRDYRDLGKRIDPELPRLFGTLPRNSWGVRPIPRFAAPSSPAAYYFPGSVRSGVPGFFLVNTHALDQRPKYGMVSLTIHEAVPGHHFQGAIADELKDSGRGIHEFRSLGGYTAYVEGWALYAEGLGLEMGEKPLSAGGRGLYADPYDYFGRLSDEIWRACRLVVDTGLHGRFEIPGGDGVTPTGSGWTRQHAIDYMLANTAGTELDTISEVDRYIGWPGQACAYKLGELKIKELRALAQQELGERFDVRAFHDAILGEGPLPLPVLEQVVRRWISRQQAAPNRAGA